MTNLLSSFTAILLALTLLLSGLYAGLALMCQIGVLPVMRRVPPQTYATVWREMDAIMDRAMPPLKLTLLVLTAATAGCLLYNHHLPLASVVLVSFGCSLIALVLTIVKQLPVNARLKALPQAADERVLLEILDETIQNFAVRLVFAVASFAALCFGVAFFAVA